MSLWVDLAFSEWRRDSLPGFELQLSFNDKPNCGDARRIVFEFLNECQRQAIGPGWQSRRPETQLRAVGVWVWVEDKLARARLVVKGPEPALDLLRRDGRDLWCQQLQQDRFAVRGVYDVSVVPERYRLSRHAQNDYSGLFCYSALFRKQMAAAAASERGQKKRAVALRKARLVRRRANVGRPRLARRR